MGEEQEEKTGCTDTDVDGETKEKKKRKKAEKCTSSLAVLSLDVGMVGGFILH